MNNFYIYKLNYNEGEIGSAKLVSSTVIFCDRVDINEDNLRDEIKRFYEANYQTDKVFIIGGEYLKDNLLEVFIAKQEKTFIGIPKRQDTFLKDNIYVLTFNKEGSLTCHNGKTIPRGFSNLYLNEGVQNIFIKRGGLITSQGSHHFVFPSGKHCDKFLRTGNILIVSSEIYFIAFALLKHFDETKYNQIYCDTSSINSIAFALSELKNRFIPPADRKQIPIESFSSYDGLYKNSFSYSKNALLLISASTSSNIISYILDSHPMIERSNIVVLYYLGEEKNYSNIKDKVMCNLTHHSKRNVTGVPFYPTYKEENCEHCKRGSYPVAVSGDVFLLEKPKLNRIILSVTDAEKNLSDLVHQFKSSSKRETVFKVNYKENTPQKYEVYINYYEILEGLSKGRYDKYRSKLHDYINQYIPSNTRFIVFLNDRASENLAKYIFDEIKANYIDSKMPKIISQENLHEIENVAGTVLVVGSCISNGKNLLYISRALRKHDHLRIVYFTGICRTYNKEHLNFLKSNLKQGCYGAETNSFIEVENLFCNNNSKDTSWQREISFLNEFIDFLKDESAPYPVALAFFENRKKILLESSGEKERGLSEKLFYPRVTTDPYQELVIRKNFAFFKFDKYDDDVTQSDIYFTISNVINSLRNSEKNDRNLKQTVYVRGILDPANFNRFNDGIIQASILRAASADELAYVIDEDLSQEMYNTLETIIRYHKNEQGEALLEFMYAIASRKLSLKKLHLQKLLEIIEKECNEELLKSFAYYIRKKILDDNIKMVEILEPVGDLET